MGKASKDSAAVAGRFSFGCGVCPYVSLQVAGHIEVLLARLTLMRLLLEGDYESEWQSVNIRVHR